jgi:hypothetical protein
VSCAEVMASPRSSRVRSVARRRCEREPTRARRCGSRRRTSPLFEPSSRTWRSPPSSLTVACRPLTRGSASRMPHRAGSRPTPISALETRVSRPSPTSPIPGLAYGFAGIDGASGIAPVSAYDSAARGCAAAGREASIGCPTRKTDRNDPRRSHRGHAARRARHLAHDAYGLGPALSRGRRDGRRRRRRHERWHDGRRRSRGCHERRRDGGLGRDHGRPAEGRDRSTERRRREVGRCLPLGPDRRREGRRRRAYAKGPAGGAAP